MESMANHDQFWHVWVLPESLTRCWGPWCSRCRKATERGSCPSSQPAQLFEQVRFAGRKLGIKQKRKNVATTRLAIHEIFPSPDLEALAGPGVGARPGHGRFTRRQRLLRPGSF